eukprot:jgi/Chrpa1/11618/Chrysochromulina_OHIO_Genome00004283-RA
MLPIQGLLKTDMTDTTFCEMLKHLARIAGFVGVAVIIYTPYEASPTAFNKPVDGWDENRTADSWGTFLWDWDWIDCMYFAVVTLCTVGYGDMPTLNQGLRLFTIFYAVIGVVVVAKSITVIADWFSEQGRKRFITKQRVLLQEAHKAAAVVMGMQKRDGVSSLPPSPEKSRSPPPSPPTGSATATAAAAVDVRQDDDSGSNNIICCSAVSRSDGRGSSSIGSSSSSSSSSEPFRGEVPFGALLCGAPSIPPLPPSPPPSPSVQIMPTTDEETELQRTKRERRPSNEVTDGCGSKDLLDRVMSKSTRKDLCRVLAALRPTGVYFSLCIILGELENAHIEGCGHFGAGWACGSTGGCDAWKLTHENGSYCWTWVDEFYYGVITFLTIGFGDVSPHTKGGKALATLLVMMGVFSFTTLLAELNDISQAKRLGADKTLQQRLDELNEVIEQDDDGKVTTEEYIIFNLKKMGKVDDDTISLLRDQFKALDADGSGELDADDIKLLSQAAAQVAAGQAD